MLAVLTTPLSAEPECRIRTAWALTDAQSLARQSPLQAQLHLNACKGQLHGSECDPNAPYCGASLGRRGPIRSICMHHIYLMSHGCLQPASFTPQTTQTKSPRSIEWAAGVSS